MPRHLINVSYIELISFIGLVQSSFINIGSLIIFIAIHVVHLNVVYDKAKFNAGWWGKPVLLYHIIDRLSIISKFNDRQKVKDNNMTVLLITSMGSNYSEMMFRSAYPNKSSYGVVKTLRKRDIRKEIIFAFSDFVLLLVC